MKKFTNITSNNKEKAVKVGTNIPNDAAGLAWFTTTEISPLNNIVTVDVSETIPENKISESTKAEIMYADEMGILRRMNGSSSVSTDDLTISNLFLHKPTVSETLEIEDINVDDFGHYYYISRYFMAGPAGYSLISLNSFPDQDEMYSLGIKVLDEDGRDYANQLTGKKKYKILLEPYKTSFNSNFTEIPYRVIVILDSDNPVNLRLMYNKIEADENGAFSNQQLRYTESINAVKYFSELAEESFVIDPNYYGSRNFAIKKIDQKYLNISSNKKATTNGYQILTPSKAIKDYRNYEVFNWRIIGKIRRNISTQNIDYGFSINDSTINLVKSVKAAVIYSGQSSENINTYALYRLQRSPFNLTKVNFENPLSQEIDQSRADYWKIDIDEINSTDLSQLDILVWSPDSAITAYQASVINDFVTNNFGTVILDLSKCPDASKLNVAGQLNMTNSVAASSVYLNNSNVLIDANKNGGWTINESIFEKDYYSVIGSSRSNGVLEKVYRYFSNTSPNNSFVNVGPSEQSAQPVGLIISYAKQNDSLAKGNIVATTYPLLSYCNSIYSISDSDKVVSANIAEQHDGDINSSGAYSSVVEGPFKILFNSISYGLYSKAHSKKEINTVSSLINFVTDWSSSWVMYSDALEESEKEDFELISISASRSVYCKNLTKQVASSSNTIFDYFKSEIMKKLNQFQKSLLEEISVSDIDFFVEVTNPDVSINNATKVVDPNDTNIDIPTSYYLHSVNRDSSNDGALSPLHAYTDKYSRSLQRLAGLGPHILMKRPINSSDTKNLLSAISGSASFNSYPFKLKSYYSSYQGSDIPYSFDFSLSGKATYTVAGTYVGFQPVQKPKGQVNRSENATNIKSAIDDYQLLRTTRVSDSSNIFPYTGDIDIHGDPRIWKQGSPQHAYVKYIQYTLSAAGLYKGALDGKYGPVTANAVLAFQKKYNLRYEDSKVDSETKWHLAIIWLAMIAFQGKKVYDDWKLFINDENVRKYMTAVENIGLATNINSAGKVYRKTTFTGTVGPNQGSDIIFFEAPSSLVKVKGITIVPDQSLKWRNFRVTAYGYSSSFKTDSSGKPAPLSYDKGEVVNFSALSGNIEIPINEVNLSQARYMWINVIGDRIAGHGEGEGFGISQIRIKGTVDGGTYTDYEPVDIPTDVDVEVSFSSSFQGLSPSSQKSISLDTARELSLTSHSISSLTYQGQTISTTTQNLSIGSAGFNNGSLKIDSFLRNKGSISLSNLSVNNIKVAGDKEISGNPINLVQNGNRIIFETSATYYGNSLIKTETIDLSSGYRLKNLSGQIFPQGKNTINYGDGILLVCDENGQPVGIPSYDQIKSAIDASTYDDVSQEEKDLRYGYFSIFNELQDNGLKYGFYDVSEKRFIGNNINYIDLYSRSGQPFSRNSSNLFIAICALDADGLSGDNEFYGLNNSSTFIPTPLPIKYLVPIYSVKYRNSTAIKVSELPESISKFDAWEIPVTNGSFEKEIFIRQDILWHDWKSSYKGQYLLAEYSTIDIPNLTWSKIYGHGYYDIISESPIILDSKTIKIRRSPIVSWNHPTNYLESLVGIVKPEIKVFTRESIESDWLEVDYSLVKDINSYTGIISFKTALVPESQKLIKVSYTTEDKNLMIKEINGTPIPINPLLNADSIVFDKPMYIYITPKNIYKRKNYVESFLSNIYNEDLGYEKISDYEYSSAVNFTYDSSLFNRYSINYDPFALPIAILYITNRPSNEPVALTDIRLRGGGLSADLENSEVIETLPQVLSYWDTYPAQSYTYSKGGYVIVRVPEEVKENFINSSEVREIVRNNLTAGVVFDLQNLEGEPWI